LKIEYNRETVKEYEGNIERALKERLEADEGHTATR
jgi:hypothetical protein